MATTSALGRLQADRSALFVCDVQERFRPVISNMPAVIDTAARMVRGCSDLKVPIIVTEQYPKALGNTVDEVKQHLPEGTPIVAKTMFTMMVPEVETHLRGLADVKQVILLGIEAHVCVLATALDLLEKGYEVHLITDGVSSQRLEDRSAALHRLMQAGALVSTSEMAFFQMMGHAKHPNFKAISSLAKEQRPEQLPRL